MERIEIIIGVIVLSVFYIWIGLLLVYANCDWLKGRSILWYVAHMMLWPIALLVFIFALPWILLCEIFKDGKKPPKKIYIDPAILAALKWVKEQKNKNP